MVLWLAKKKTSKITAHHIGLCLFVSSFKNFKAVAITEGVLTPKIHKHFNLREERQLKLPPGREHGSGAKQPHTVGSAVALVPRMPHPPVPEFHHCLRSYTLIRFSQQRGSQTTAVLATVMGGMDFSVLG